MEPLVKLAEYELPLPLGTVMPVMVSGAFPEFVMVSVALALWPTVTLPNARFPARPMMRVEGDVVGDDGDDGDDELLPPQADRHETRTGTAKNRAQAFIERSLRN
jgi:hypothetical protein